MMQTGADNTQQNSKRPNASNQQLFLKISSHLFVFYLCLIPSPMNSAFLSVIILIFVMLCLCDVCCIHAKYTSY